MKRIMTTVVALAAVLSIGTVANAAPFTFDVSGANGSVVTVSSVAPDPCTGTATPKQCLTNPLSAGSSLNGDITGSTATLHGGAIFTNTASVLFGLVTITADVDATIGSATGTVVGHDILWDTPASYTVSPTSTLVCTDLGPSMPVSCETLSLTAGTVYPISILNVLLNSSGLASVDLGMWDLSPDLSQLLGSTRAVTSVSNVDGSEAGWYYFGADLGFVPEPGSMALVLLGLGGLALRARKA